MNIRSGIVRILDKIVIPIAAVLKRILPAALFSRLERFLSSEFVLFAAVGAVNTLSTAAFATIFDNIAVFENIQKYNISFITAYILSMIISFFLNTCLTFGERPTLKKAVKFPFSYIPNFLIQLLCVRIFTYFGAVSGLTYIIAAVIGLPVTFITMRFMVKGEK